jgi:hypothetical protein
MAGHGMRRTTGLLAATGLVLSGCGSTEPEPLEPIPPAVPADLCASVPEDARRGLTTSSSTDETGNPTAACALRSGPGGQSDVRAVLTWTQLNDEDTAQGVLESQCRAIDPQEFARRDPFQVEGGDQACAGRGKSADSATLAVLSGREVLTVRMTADPAGQPDALSRGTTLAEGVLASLAGG